MCNAGGGGARNILGCVRFEPSQNLPVCTQQLATIFESPVMFTSFYLLNNKYRVYTDRK